MATKSWRRIYAPLPAHVTAELNRRFMADTQIDVTRCLLYGKHVTYAYKVKPSTAFPKWLKNANREERTRIEVLGCYRDRMADVLICGLVREWRLRGEFKKKAMASGEPTEGRKYEIFRPDGELFHLTLAIDEALPGPRDGYLRVALDRIQWFSAMDGSLDPVLTFDAHFRMGALKVDTPYYHAAHSQFG